ncbi:MAG: DUF5069 domain-containing protein [Candidatus Eremiobacteraeota bacterium]|nr:DUF5069 domain-containing protein [Candidatus Eremiobacteraeota bacterium]
MEVKDLRVAPPRRWSEQIAGIYWLPRLIDKARAALAGMLGDYLFGQSPMDHGLLRELGLSHREFAAIVKDAPGDEAVVAAIEARDPAALTRARAWSDRLPAEHKMFFWCIDVDDGYRKSGRLHGLVRVVANGIARTAKRLWPSYAAERAAAERR